MPLPLIGFLGPMLLGGVFTPALEPFGNVVRQLGYKVLPSQLLPIQNLIVLRMREEIPIGDYRSTMRTWGYDTEASERIFVAAQFFPSAQDLVTWTAKEVFEPGSVEKYGLADEFENLDLSLFAKAGVSDEQARNFWIAHWQHPSFTQVVEMLRRDVLRDVVDRTAITVGTPEWVALRVVETAELFDWYKLVEIPPHWREKLTATSFAVPTRVDTRRMWDLRVIDEEQILRNALDRGLDIEDARREVVFTKVSTDFPDLMQRYSNGWISAADVRERLVSWGMPEERATELLETRMDNLARPTRIARERDLTKAEIVKGVKKKILTFDQGVVLLEGMGYDPGEAQFVLDINIESEGSPETPLDFLRLVGGYRTSQGQKSIAIPQQLRDAERRVLASRRVLDGILDNGTGDVGPALLDFETALQSFKAEVLAAGLPESILESYELPPAVD